MGEIAYVSALPDCDVCKAEGLGVPKSAHYDAKTLAGPWAYLCKWHFESETAGVLGTGVGQRLVVGPKPNRSDLIAALERGDYDAAEDIVGDGDLAEWL